MSNDRKQLRELHGIGSSSARGTKRAAELPNASRLYDMGNNTQWSSKPTTIPTPGSQSVRRPNQVATPYSGRNLRDSIGLSGNPIARKTVTDTPPPKKRKVSGGGFDESEVSSRFFAKGMKSGESSSFKEPRAITSTVPAGTGSLRNAAEVSRLRLGESSFRNKPAPPLSMKPTSPSQEIISIDDSESERDIRSGVPRSTSFVLDSRDELDLIGGPSRSPVLSRKPTSNGKLSNGKMVEVQEGRSSITPSRKQTPIASINSSASRERSRRLVEDGESTKRLNDKLSARLPHESPTPRSAHIYPELVPDDEVVDVDEIEEIEDADGFPETPRALSSKDHIEVQMRSRQVKRAPTPGSSSIKPGTVKQRADEIEEKGKKVLKHYADLTLAGPQKKSVIGNMKGKDKSTSVTNRRKASSSRTIGPSFDRLATAQTSYTQKLALPLEICVWGNRLYRLDEEQTDPDYWLYWNKDASELQLHKHPVTDINKKKAIHSIKFSLLKECYPTISSDPDFHLVRFEFDKDFDQSVPEDIVNTGFAFKFLSRHSNMTTDWDSLFSRIKAQAYENGRELRRVVGAGTRACLESALQSVSIPEPKPQNRGKETKDTNRSAPAELNDDDDTDAPVVEKRKQPRPRPANRKNQNIDEMFTAAVPTRRSTRLSSEARKPYNQDKQDKQDEEETPPANLEEIILVYPPSGQGAVNITNGDLRRLQPSEFLNDTIIELGLKFWLNNLRAEQPELADEIHVFSSFFFKKLASRANKTPEDGHKSVRKWTAKVDIFKKKYIIVPINENIHWYLAIIYNPEHILDPPLPKPTPRTSKRVSDAASRVVTRSLRKDKSDVAINANTSGSVSREGTVENRDDTSATWENNSDAAEVEKELMNDTDGNVVQDLRRCSLDESHFPAERSMQRNGDDVSTGSLSIVEDEVERPESARKAVKPDPVVVEDSLSEGSDGIEVDQLDEDDVPTTSQAVNSTVTTPPSTLTDVKMDLSSPEPDPNVLSPMDVDDRSNEAAKDSPESSMSVDDLSERDNQASRASSASKTPGETTQTTGAVPSTSFYGGASQRTGIYQRGKRTLFNGNKDQSNPASDVDELDVLGHREVDRGSSEELEVTQRSRTIIFCMDSLGSAHPRALSRLNEYLQEEAKDKKGIQNPSTALTKKALVPVQPNFCDCGLYLLHFAQTFMTDPKKYKEVIFASKKMTGKERNELWHNDRVATMRERMKDRILTESETWKKLKAEKELKQKSLENKDKDVVSNGDNTNITGQASANQTEQSDDEIEVSEVRHVGPSPSPKKQPTARAGKAPSNPATRLR
ncbi:uncharacterized protein FOMMEDRAFT_171324 [Fomitiporia mediterranea MF3/22]|uniref:uncharacterized protein n=1 Tax=Fomitiporia mediterranea (strain MF3/22) TaxID=694068 RepID=UPI00044074AB|nr:uncharacterized protein FOMMEDRAFT_171324 [Fomitiporia mediterranea MF3/22]EJC97929.1 hypothetical protein FOMMEDRAFT_171324 [Fomitiporia mediterranea MF3/22]